MGRSQPVLPDEIAWWNLYKPQTEKCDKLWVWVKFPIQIHQPLHQVRWCFYAASNQHNERLEKLFHDCFSFVSQIAQVSSGYVTIYQDTISQSFQASACPPQDLQEINASPAERLHDDFSFGKNLSIALAEALRHYYMMSHRCLSTASTQRISILNMLSTVHALLGFEMPVLEWNDFGTTVLCVEHAIWISNGRCQTCSPMLWMSQLLAFLTFLL